MKEFRKVNVNVAGVTFKNRQGVLWNLKKHDENSTLILHREKNNAADPNAIKVVAVCEGTKAAVIGYVPRKISFWLAKKMDEGKIVRCYHQKKNGASLPFVQMGPHLGCHMSVVYEA